MKNMVDFYFFARCQGLSEKPKDIPAKFTLFKTCSPLKMKPLKKTLSYTVLSMKYVLARQIHFGEKVHDFAGRTARGKKCFQVNRVYL